MTLIPEGRKSGALTQKSNHWGGKTTKGGHTKKEVNLTTVPKKLGGLLPERPSHQGGSSTKKGVVGAMGKTS